MEGFHSLQLKRIIEKLGLYEPECIVLFGSHARGEADEYSDLERYPLQHQTWNQ